MYGSSTTGTYPSPSSDNRYPLLHHSLSFSPSYATPRYRTASLSSDHLPPFDTEQPLSPLNSSFSGGVPSPSMAVPGIPSAPHHDYGPSPPDTGNSSSSNPRRLAQQDGLGTSSPPSSKQYSFVSLPGNAVRKRPRRRYDEIERLYQCSWPECTKAYGTLNHLNAHVMMQKHGVKRSPNGQSLVSSEPPKKLFCVFGAVIADGWTL